MKKKKIIVILIAIILFTILFLFVGKGDCPKNTGLMGFLSCPNNQFWGLGAKLLIIAPTQNTLLWLSYHSGPYLTFLCLVLLVLFFSAVYLLLATGLDFKKFISDPINYIPKTYSGYKNNNPKRNMVILLLFIIISFFVIWIIYRGFLVPQLWGWPVPQYIQDIGRYTGIEFGAPSFE